MKTGEPPEKNWTTSRFSKMTKFVYRTMGGVKRCGIVFLFIFIRSIFPHFFAHPRPPAPCGQSCAFGKGICARDCDKEGNRCSLCLHLADRAPIGDTFLYRSSQATSTTKTPFAKATVHVARRSSVETAAIPFPYRRHRRARRVIAASERE